MSQSSEAVFELYCPRCGYNLRGIQSERCPECGEPVDRSAIAGSVIPWTHRAILGVMPAFLRTIGFILRTPRTAAKQVAFPISYRDAQLFRWLVILLAAVPLCISVLALRALAGDSIGPVMGYASSTQMGGTSSFSPMFDYLVSAWVGLMLWPVPSIAIVLTLAAFTGAPSFFFHPKSLPVVRQNRAVALSYYGCAPLVLTILPCLCIWVAMFMSAREMTDRRTGFQIAAILGIVGVGGPPALIAMCWFNTLYLLRASMQASTTRILMTGGVLLLLWIGLAVLTLFAFPALCGFYRLMTVT